jgi:hypothetical protein
MRGWACWSYRFEHGRWSKLSFQPLTGQRVDASDPFTWCSFAEALAAYQHQCVPAA